MPDDLDALYDFHRLPEVARYLYNEPRTRAEVSVLLHGKLAASSLTADGKALCLAAELAATLLRLGFEGLGLHRIIGRCDGRNLGSARVMEHNGMRREAHLVENEFVKGEWTDELIYAILRREWEGSARGR